MGQSRQSIPNEETMARINPRLRYETWGTQVSIQHDPLCYQAAGPANARSFAALRMTDVFDPTLLQFLLALDIADAGKAAKAVHKADQMADVGGVDDKLDDRLRAGARFGIDRADIGAIV